MYQPNSSEIPLLQLTLNLLNLTQTHFFFFSSHFAEKICCSQLEIRWLAKDLMEHCTEYSLKEHVLLSGE